MLPVVEQAQQWILMSDEIETNTSKERPARLNVGTRLAIRISSRLLALTLIGVGLVWLQAILVPFVLASLSLFT